MVCIRLAVAEVLTASPFLQWFFLYQKKKYVVCVFLLSLHPCCCTVSFPWLSFCISYQRGVSNHVIRVLPHTSRSPMPLHNHILLLGRTFPQAGAIVGFWVHNFTRAPACPGSGPARKSSLRELSKYPALIPPLALGKSVRERKLCTNLLSPSPLFLLHLFP